MTQKHPMQPIVLDERGMPRFVQNDIVRHLLDNGGINLNDISRMASVNKFSREDQEQFAMLIGYSTSGFGELDYASPRRVGIADRAADNLLKAAKP